MAPPSSEKTKAIMPADKNQPWDAAVKVVIIGNSSVGKTCLLTRYADNTFSTNYMNTIGVDFRIKTLTVEGKTIKLQVWDTAGQERFNTITASFLRGAAGVVLVYDITNAETFTGIMRWAKETENMEQVLVGNKCIWKIADEWNKNKGNS